MTIIKQTIAEYAKSPVNGYAYFTESPDGQFFTVVDVYQSQGIRQASTGLIVHITQDHIVIERDLNNKPLVDALMQRRHIPPADCISLRGRGRARTGINAFYS